MITNAARNEFPLNGRNFRRFSIRWKLFDRFFQSMEILRGVFPLNGNINHRARRGTDKRSGSSLLLFPIRDSFFPQQTHTMFVKALLPPQSTDGQLLVQVLTDANHKFA